MYVWNLAMYQLNIRIFDFVIDVFVIHEWLVLSFMIFDSLDIFDGLRFVADLLQVSHGVGGR